MRTTFLGARSWWSGRLLALALATGCQSPSTAARSPVEPAPSTGLASTASATGIAAPETTEARPPSLPLPSGIAFGEVSQESVRVWSRCDRDARLHARLSNGASVAHASLPVTAESDFAASLPFTGLEAGQRFRVTVWCSEPQDEAEEPRPRGLEGTFSTAPAATATNGVRFAWGGDLGGQNVCRDAKEGYPIFEPLQAGSYAFFIALGDMIYADTPCGPIGMWGNAQVPREVSMASTVDGFRAHWRYNRDDAKYRAFLASTPYYGVWDDHEVVNDWGPKTDVRYHSPYRAGEHLMPAALRAMFDYNPFPDGNRLYRRYRWGKHAEVFFLDTRQYRDDNARRDAKTKRMLGTEQTTWLIDALTSSDATWKFVISSVPLSIPTGLNKDARDGFADFDGKTGFEHELGELLDAMRDRQVGHTVWLTTDVHMAAGFSYVPFPDSPEFVVHEFVSGPLSAGFYPRKVYDPTFRPTRLFTWADDVRGVKDYAGAKELFNFGDVTIDADGRLTVGIVNALGTRVRSVEVQRGKP